MIALPTLYMVTNFHSGTTNRERNNLCAPLLRPWGGIVMEVKDMVGMMSTGALLALGVVFVLDKLNGPDPVAPQVVSFQAPVQQQAPVAQPAQQAAVAETVTSADVNLLGQSTAAQIGRIVALSQQGLNQTNELTAEQKEIVKFFECTARQMNQQDKMAANGHIQFSNMAVRGLNVRYFYRVPQDYAEVNSTALLNSQQVQVRRTLCDNTAIRTLLSDYGFAYTYTYVSGDSRQLGQISADARICA